MTGELEQAYGQIKSYALESAIAKKREQKIRNIFQKYVPKEVIDKYFRNPESMLVGREPRSGRSVLRHPGTSPRSPSA